MAAVVVMGVCGTGKTTVGEALAGRLGCRFLEGDEFHPPENVEKMARGEALEDGDRWPWLDRLGDAIGAAVRAEGTADPHVVASCSALKRVYRDRLRARSGEAILFVLLDGDEAMLTKRMAARTDHYMPPSLLPSQLRTLERPAADEEALVLDAGNPPAVLVEKILAAR
jgi:gluconokinase